MNVLPTRIASPLNCNVLLRSNIKRSFHVNLNNSVIELLLYAAVGKWDLYCNGNDDDDNNDSHG